MERLITSLIRLLDRVLSWDTALPSHVKVLPSEAPPEPQNTPLEPVTPPSAPKPQTVPPTVPESEAKPLPPKPKSMLDTFCTAIRDFEGKPGNQNYRYNNPGNYRFSPVGYLPKYGNVKRSANGFAIFPTYELGWQYHQASVLHWATLHPNWTILDFFHHYAPPSDDNPTEAYAANVAKKCGVPVSTTLKVLFG